MVNRALDIGCSVGRITFELAREYEEVVGVDYSQPFVEKCNELKREGQAEYDIAVEGELVDHKIAVIDSAIVSSHFTLLHKHMCLYASSGDKS